MSSGTSASIRGKVLMGRYPSELRIVLIGGRHGGGPSGKSSVGNIILGRDVFKTKRLTSKSVMRQEEVLGRQVTVVDTPGWRSTLPLDLTPKLTQLEIQQSVNLCPPGPHVFALVMRLDLQYVGTGMSAEEHVRFLLSDRAWEHTIVVFTVADKNNMRPDLIRSDPELRYLTEKCEGRFHILNISDRGDGSQVTELLQKVDQMVTSNGCHYKTKEHVSEELKEMERTIRRRAEQRTADTQKQTAGLPKEIALTDLRIVLLGSQRSGKSSAGNTILTGSGFKVSQIGQRSVQCEVRHGEVAGRHVTVVDSPGWWYNSLLQDTSEMDKLEIQNSVSLCPPGPHAVLLTVPLHQAFTKAQRVAVEEHMTLLSQSVWSQTSILFTCGDCLEDRSIEQHIEAEGEDLRWLVDKCGNRYHVFNNQKIDVTQVTQLLEKIEEMVSGNTGGHYEDDGDEKMSERKRNIEEHVHTFMTKTHRQRTALKALFEGEHQSLADVRLMLIGAKQEERSGAGNLILQQDVFTETPFKEFKTQTKLTECVRQQSRVADRNVRVVNCPDWSTTPPSWKIKNVLLHGLTLCSPGPHAVLVTVDVRSSFSEADRRSVEEHMELLGDRVWRHTLVLFTQGYWLGERHVEEYIESEGEPLRWLLEKSGLRYHVQDGLKWDISEVTELMVKIEDMVTLNSGHFGPSRQKTLVERLKGKKTEEEWKKREQEIVERMLVSEPEEPTLPAARRRNSMDHRFIPSMSGGTPSEAGSSCRWSPDKVSDWLLKKHPGPIASSSGYDTMSEVPSQADTDSVYRGHVGPLDSTEDSSVRDTGHFKVGHGPRQKTLFEKLTGKKNLEITTEEWRRREQDLIERMLKFVVSEPEEPTLPAVRRRNSMAHGFIPSMSGGAPSEAGGSYCWSPDKVSDWLKRHPAPSSGYATMSEAPTQADTDVGTIPLHGEMEEHPATEPLSSLHPSLELQDETDLSSCFSGLKIEESISLPRSHSSPSLSQIPCLENKESFRANQSHSLNDVTVLDKTQKITPDIIVVEDQESYSFHCTQAGLFQCNLTDLVFKMETEGDVTYRTVPWHRRLIAKFSKRAAGPLFDIKGSQGSVCQLQFPHCEILSMGGGKSLSVVHVVDDGIELIKPLVITETHVIINVTGLSLFGIIREMLFGPRPVQALVSLFYTPPIEDDPSSILKVLLLPGNVVRHEVMNKRREINGEEIYIEVSLCKLIPNQEYTLSTSPRDDSIIVLPNKAEFEVDELSYHNYMPTFVINLEESFSHVRLLLSNSNTSSVCAWEGYVKLSAAALRKQQVQHTVTIPAEERLFSVRSSFIDRVSLPNLNGLLDKLLERSIITDAEREMADGMQMRKDKARFVIDTVRRKGPDASSKMILILCDLDMCLSEHLGLM